MFAGLFFEPHLEALGLPLGRELFFFVYPFVSAVQKKSGAKELPRDMVWMIWKQKREKTKKKQLGRRALFRVGFRMKHPG